MWKLLSRLRLVRLFAKRVHDSEMKCVGIFHEQRAFGLAVHIGLRWRVEAMKSLRN